MDPNLRPNKSQTGAPPASHWRKDEDLDEASKESFPASDPPAYNAGISKLPPEQPPAPKESKETKPTKRSVEKSTMGSAPKKAVENPQSGEQAPMGANPPEAPKIDKVVADAYREVQPKGFKDHPESSVEAADFDVDDTSGGE